MSLKNEIQKLIENEQQKLEKNHRERQEAYAQEEKSFQRLRVLLEELVASIDSDHFESYILDYRAVLKIGRLQDDYFEVKQSWEISAKIDKGLESDETEHLPNTQRSFCVKETHHGRFPDYHDSDQYHSFSAEQETMEYIIKRISEQLAYYRHLDKLAGNGESNLEQ